MKSRDVYKINDLVKALDRDKTTILRWEKQGLIPKAKRDSRGWRYYTKSDYDEIIKKIHETSYFRNKILPVAIIISLAILSVSIISVTNYVYGVNGNQNANLNVTAGALTAYASSTVQTFSDVAYSFNPATSTATVGAETKFLSVGVEDARGGAGSWTLGLSCLDNTKLCNWTGATEEDRFLMSGERV